MLFLQERFDTNKLFLQTQNAGLLGSTKLFLF
jgi:hypothetical protein